MIGALALAAGVLVYLTDRDTASAALVPTVAGIAGTHLFGAIGQWLPSFVHPFAFSLFSAAASTSLASRACGACATWWAINVAFEAAQHPLVRPAVADGVEGLLGQTRASLLLTNYFFRGTFDAGDLAAATAGALAAAGVMTLSCRLEKTHGH
jgi:hypothetical protein